MPEPAPWLLTTAEILEAYYQPSPGLILDRVEAALNRVSAAQARKLALWLNEDDWKLGPLEPARRAIAVRDWVRKEA